MSGSLRRETAWALGLALVIVFPIAAHLALHQLLFGAWLALVPLAGCIIWVIRRWRYPGAALAAVAVAAVIVWRGWPLIEQHFAGVFFFEHAGANLALAIVFGRTLLRNREPLCTRFARLLHGTLPPEVERYTRNITGAWTIFFSAVVAVSSVLYLGGNLPLWSLFANIGSPILVAAMFVVEYLVRHRVLPQWERTSVLDGIRAFARHFATAQPEAPR